MQKIVFPMNADKRFISLEGKVIGVVIIDSPLLRKKHQGFLANYGVLCAYRKKSMYYKAVTT